MRRTVAGRPFASSRVTKTGYFIDPVMTQVVFLAAKLNKPLLLERLKAQFRLKREDGIILSERVRRVNSVYQQFFQGIVVLQQPDVDLYLERKLAPKIAEIIRLETEDTSGQIGNPIDTEIDEAGAYINPRTWTRVRWRPRARDVTHPAIAAFDAEHRRVAMQVSPVPTEANMGAQALAFFLDGGPVHEGEVVDVASDAGPDEVRRLHAELKLAQEGLVASRNSQELAVQDLRASNEELQSINEEYRSTAEELETSKEELQSINEELHTVNAELKSKLASISVAHSDLENLTTATDIGALFLDTDLRIKMFTPPVAELFNITRADIGRAVTDFRHSLQYEELEHDAQQVLRRLSPLEREVRSRNGRWYVVRLRPYRTIEDRIDGTVVTFVEITERRKTEQALRESEERQAYFLALSDALRPLADQEEIQAEAMRLLGEKIGVNRAQYYIADETGEYLSSSGGYSNGIPAAIGRFRLIEFGKYAYDGFHAGETQVMSDATTDPRISEAVLRSYETVGFLAYIGVPFVQRGRLVGTVAVHPSQPRLWTDSERMMVEETAERAGIAVEQARAESALRESQERQAFLLKLSDALRPLNDPAAVQAAAMKLPAEHLGVFRTLFLEVDPDGNGITKTAGFEPEPKLPARMRLSDFGDETAANHLSGRTTMAEDTWLAGGTEAQLAAWRAIDVRAWLATPLVKDGRLLAVQGVHDRTPRVWTTAEIRLLEEVAERTWASVERARAETALRESEGCSAFAKSGRGAHAGHS